MQSALPGVLAEFLAETVGKADTVALLELPKKECSALSSKASPKIWSCYANLNHYHYSFL